MNFDQKGCATKSLNEILLHFSVIGVFLEILCYCSLIME